MENHLTDKSISLNIESYEFGVEFNENNFKPSALMRGFPGYRTLHMLSYFGDPNRSKVFPMLALLRSKSVKAILIRLILTLTLLLCAFLTMLTNPFAGKAHLKSPVTVVAQEDRIRDDVSGLIATGSYRNYRSIETLNEAANYIEASWQAAGFEVQRSPFEVKGKTYQNLSIFYGDRSKPRLVMGAHYDVYAEQDGADDNASGVAAILEIARLLSEAKPELPYHLELVAFTLEEPPFFRSEHMGSAVHANSLVQTDVEVLAMISLDCIGYFSEAANSQAYPAPGLNWIYPTVGDYIAVVGRVGDWGLTRRVKSLMCAGSELPVLSMNAPASIPGIDFSDHHNYWPHGINAVLITNSAFYRNHRYHTVEDTADTLDYPRLRQVVQSLYTMVTHF
jgi:hypothetical protein